MRIEITEDKLNILDEATQKFASRIICDEIVYFLQHNIKYDSNKWPYQATGEKAMNYIIRDVISQEVATVIRKRIDEITKKAIKQTAMSIRANPRYSELRCIITEMLHEEGENEPNK